MPLNVLFWVIYIISVLVASWAYYEPTVTGQRPWFFRAGGYYILWLLVGMIGWRVFGPAVR